MEYKTFTSPERWFKLQLPKDWDEYDEDEGTYGFFDTIKWTGNLRVTPMFWQSDLQNNKAEEFLKDEFNDNLSLSPQRFKVGQYECVSYKKNIQQDGDDLVIFYWTLGKNNRLFLCSFTINKDMENGSEEELKKVKSIINSIAEV